MLSADSLQRPLEYLAARELATDCERTQATKLFRNDFVFADVFSLARSLHIHIKLEDTSDLVHDELIAAGAELEYEKEGFIKFRFPGGINLIFSSIPVSEDELIEREHPESRRPRPFVDHFGIDLRDESDEVNGLFAEIPRTADRNSWPCVVQGEGGAGVHCCHTEVKQKYWVFPELKDGFTIPFEFALGALKWNDVSGGCDLRPTHPSRAKDVPQCHAPEGNIAETATTSHVS